MCSADKLPVAVLTALLAFGACAATATAAPDPGDTGSPAAEDCSAQPSADGDPPCPQGDAEDRSSGQPTAPDADSRNEASIAIAENTQSAFLLKELFGKRRFGIFGRAEGEFALYDIPALDGEDGVEIRRLRVGIAGYSPLFKRLSYKVEFDLTDKENRLSSIYVNLDFDRYGTVTAGNIDSSQSLSSSTGSLSQLFMESPLPIDAFGLSKRVGISWTRTANRGGLYLMAFGRDLNSDARHQGVAGRAWINPFRSKDGIWHLGTSIVRENISDETRIRTRPESHVTGVRLVDTGDFDDVSSDSRLGLELARAVGAFTMRFEYLRNDWKRDDGSRNHFRGAYLEGGYMFGGIPFRYRDGKFLRPDLTGHGWIWEFAYRYSWVDLNDDDVQGGEERNLGLAVNLYPAPGWRGQANLIYVDSDQPGGDGLLLQARVQYNW